MQMIHNEENQHRRNQTLQSHQTQDMSSPTTILNQCELLRTPKQQTHLLGFESDMKHLFTKLNSVAQNEEHDLVEYEKQMTLQHQSQQNHQESLSHATSSIACTKNDDTIEECDASRRAIKRTKVSSTTDYTSSSSLSSTPMRRKTVHSLTPPLQSTIRNSSTSLSTTSIIADESMKSAVKNLHVIVPTTTTQQSQQQQQQQQKQHYISSITKQKKRSSSSTIPCSDDITSSSSLSSQNSKNRILTPSKNSNTISLHSNQTSITPSTSDTIYITSWDNTNNTMTPITTNSSLHVLDKHIRDIHVRTISTQPSIATTPINPSQVLQYKDHLVYSPYFIHDIQNTHSLLSSLLLPKSTKSSICNNNNNINVSEYSTIITTPSSSLSSDNNTISTHDVHSTTQLTTSDTLSITTDTSNTTPHNNSLDYYISKVYSQTSTNQLLSTMNSISTPSPTRLAIVSLLNVFSFFKQQQKKHASNPIYPMKSPLTPPLLTSSSTSQIHNTIFTPMLSTSSSSSSTSSPIYLDKEKLTKVNEALVSTLKSSYIQDNHILLHKLLYNIHDLQVLQRTLDTTHRNENMKSNTFLSSSSSMLCNTPPTISTTISTPIETIYKTYATYISSTKQLHLTFEQRKKKLQSLQSVLDILSLTDTTSSQLTTLINPLTSTTSNFSQQQQQQLTLVSSSTTKSITPHISKAVYLYRLALSNNPQYYSAWYNLGVAYGEIGQIDDAITAYELALVNNPYCAEAFNNLGVLYKDKGNIDKAFKCYEQVLRLNPSFVQTLNNLGVLCTLLGRWDEAFQYCQRSIEVSPNYPEAHNNLGVLYRDEGRVEEAIRSYDMNLLLDPNSNNAAQNRLLALNSLPLDPVYIGKEHEKWGNLFIGKCLETIGKQYTTWKTEPIFYIDSLSPTTTTTSTTTSTSQVTSELEYILKYQNMFCSEYNYYGLSDIYTNFSKYITFYETFLQQLQHQISLHIPLLPPKFMIRSRPLRIGYLSSDFFTHSVSYFIEAILQKNSTNRIINICYSNVAKPDAKTKKLSQYADYWREISLLSTPQVCDMMYNDKLDILVELTGHTSGNRLDILAMKPAPIQITWIGYPNTTGLNTINYRLTDNIVDPMDTKQPYVEHLVRLPGPFLCYLPPPTSLPIANVILQQHDDMSLHSSSQIHSHHAIIQPPSTAYKTKLDTHITTLTINTKVTFKHLNTAISLPSIAETINIISQSLTLEDVFQHPEIQKLQQYYVKTNVFLQNMKNIGNLQSFFDLLPQLLQVRGLLPISSTSQTLHEASNTQHVHTNLMTKLKNPKILPLLLRPTKQSPVQASPCMNNGVFTFGSFNNLAKITNHVIEAWSQLLHAVPNSRLLLKCKPFTSNKIREAFLQKFENLGISSSRIDCLSLTSTTEEHLKTYSMIDLALDSFPYAGTTTTCEALLMGIPVLTLATMPDTHTHAQAVGTSLLSRLNTIDISKDCAGLDETRSSQGLYNMLSQYFQQNIPIPTIYIPGHNKQYHIHQITPSLLNFQDTQIHVGKELIAKNVQEFVTLGIYWANNWARLSVLRQNLRYCLLTSDICRPLKFLRGLHTTYEQIFDYHMRPSTNHPFMPSYSHIQYTNPIDCCDFHDEFIEELGIPQEFLPK